MCSDVQIFIVSAVTRPVPAGADKMSSGGLTSVGHDPTERRKRVNHVEGDLPRPSHCYWRSHMRSDVLPVVASAASQRSPLRQLWLRRSRVSRNALCVRYYMNKLSRGRKQCCRSLYYYYQMSFRACKDVTQQLHLRQPRILRKSEQSRLLLVATC